MITSFKIFENLKEDPQINDYVICESDFWSIRIALSPKDVMEFSNYIHTHIGKIISSDIINEEKQFYVIYDDLSKFLRKNSFWVTKDMIKYSSKNKEELKQLLLNNKFNL